MKLLKSLLEFGRPSETEDKRPFNNGDNVLVDNYQGVGKIHSISSNGIAKVILPNNIRVEVPLHKLHHTKSDFKSRISEEHIPNGD